MHKCRICLKCQKQMPSLYDAEDGITFFEMLNTFTSSRIRNESNFPDRICVSCSKKLKEAYNFKIDIERSEMLLNETENLKRISFNSIRDIKLYIEIDFKPEVRPMVSFADDLFKNDTDTITFHDTVIKKVKENKYDIHTTQMSVKEFLNSVKIESDDDCNDQDYEIDADCDLSDAYSYNIELNKSKKSKKPHKRKYLGNDSDSDYTCGKKLNKNKKSKMSFDSNRNKKSRVTNKLIAIKPIKPILLSDVKIAHSFSKKKKEVNKPKMKNRYPGKKSICPFCGKLYLSKYIDTHVLTHTSERKYKCDICTKSFFTDKDLERHIKLHSEEKKIKCSLCIASFINSTMLKDHMLSHSDEKNHVCDVCQKGFKRKGALYRHMKIHSFGKKSVLCELCPMSFHSNTNLRHHMRIHTGERPYKCEICSQPYSYKHDFNRHCLKKHGVFLKCRSVNIMNDEVLQQERTLMRELTLKAHGIIKNDDIPSVFQGPQGAKAFEMVMKAIEARQVPISYTDSTYIS